MAESALAKKMKLKPNQRALLVNAPDGYEKELLPLPNDVELSTALRGKFDWVQLFVKTQAEFEKQLPRVLKTLKPETMLWICFPKGTSKIQTDLTRDKGWRALGEVDMKFITLISVNATWSAFGLRRYKPNEPGQNFKWS